MKIECVNAYYFRFINKIGGIESHLRYLGKKYSDRDITVFYRDGNREQIEYISKYVSCIRIEPTDVIKCKKLFCCFNREILDQCEADEIYLVLHGDYKTMVEQGQMMRKSLPIDDRVDHYLGVSQLVCDSWKELTGIDCELVYNPLVLDKTDKPLMFMSATRLSVEKGWLRMKKLAEEMNREKINYTWFIYTDSEKKPVDNMVFLPPRLDITSKMASYDAFIQLSDNEGYCYSVVEALSQSVPVIVTDLPVLKELKVNKDNSVILPLDMSKIPFDEIRNIYKKKFDYKAPLDKWDEYLDSAPIEEIQVETLIGFIDIFDVQMNKTHELGEVFTVSRPRYYELLKYQERYGIKLIKRYGIH